MEMFTYSVYGFQILLLLWVRKLSDVESSRLVIHSGKYKHNPNYFHNFTLNIINNTVNLDMATKKPFGHGFNVHVDFAINLVKTNNYQRVFAHTMDTCSVVSTVKKNIFKAWFQSMLDHGNFLYKCPVAEGHYYLRNWKLDPNLVPQYLHAGNYRVTGWPHSAF
ncbi:uncharacterized protein LOC6556891 [Drosophila grimshawi]|uniref:uncharacterized protein LOC6556891 n=1 Tax=Drosophila grimshawi TaxID=7222 RepID=UPI001C932802|nr:uncharacterized protein LOC6556891 [Drosophila grimshawi]